MSKLISYLFVFIKFLISSQTNLPFLKVYLIILLIIICYKSQFGWPTKITNGIELNKKQRNEYHHIKAIGNMKWHWVGYILIGIQIFDDKRTTTNMSPTDHQTLPDKMSDGGLL